MEEITLIIAIIGCVTGLTSILIKLFEFLSTMARLKIEIDQSSASYFFKNKDFNVTNYEEDFSAAISLIIHNKSSNPVTISEITIKVDKNNKYNFIRSTNDFHFQVQKIPISNNSYVKYSPSEQINLPLRIESFDTVFGSARIPFFDEVVKSKDFSKPVVFKIRIKTPRKVYCRKVKLYEYLYYHDLRQKNHNI